MDAYFYIDWGSGYVLVNAFGTENLILWLKRPINDYIQRKELDGSFTLTNEGSTDFTDANTFFVINGNEKAPLRIYENGTMGGGGVLKFEGFAKIEGEFDYREEKVTFQNFETTDQYTDFLPKINNSFAGETVALYDQYAAFAAQGQHPNANKLFHFTWSGSSFSLVAGTPLAIPNLGRCDISVIPGGEFALYDSANDTLRSYLISAGQWAQVRNRFSGAILKNNNVAMTSYGASKTTIISDNANILETYSLSGASDFSIDSTVSVMKLKFPDICWTGARLAMVDELSGRLQTVAGSTGGFSLGTVKNPKICTLVAASETIAFIDAYNSNLVAYRYVTGSWVKIGEPLRINGLIAPSIAQVTNNQIIFHDVGLGSLRYYNFDGVNWTQVGSSYSITGGTMSAVAMGGSDIMLAISDTPNFRCSTMSSYYSIINSVLDKNGIQGGIAGKYELQTTGSGAAKDVQKVIMGAVSDLSDNSVDRGTYNKFKYKLADLLKWAEIYNDFYYIEDGAGVSSHKIKFVQPNSFSSTGVDIDLSSLNLAAENNQRNYNENFQIDQEEIILNNTDPEDEDFSNGKINYLRSTSIIDIKEYPFSTDLGYLTKIFQNQVFGEINSSGVVVFYLDTSTGTNLAVSGTGIISGNDIKNIHFSQSQLYDGLKDYRYKQQGNITINGTSSAVQNTCRDIIGFPEVNISYEQAGITEFPDSVASVIWSVGVKSYITEFGVNVFTKQITIRSRLLDL